MYSSLNISWFCGMKEKIGTVFKTQSCENCFYLRSVLVDPCTRSANINVDLWLIRCWSGGSKYSFYEIRQDTCNQRVFLFIQTTSPACFRRKTSHLKSLKNSEKSYLLRKAYLADQCSEIYNKIERDFV